MSFAQKIIVWEAPPTPMPHNFTLWQLRELIIAVKDRYHRLFVQSAV
jgi:hypothetical protein